MIPNVQSAIKGAPLDSFIDRTPPSSTSAQLAVLQWDHIISISIGSLIGDLLQPQDLVNKSTTTTTSPKLIICIYQLRCASQSHLDPRIDVALPSSRSPATSDGGRRSLPHTASSSSRVMARNGVFVSSPLASGLYPSQLPPPK